MSIVGRIYEWLSPMLLRPALVRRCKILFVDECSIANDHDAVRIGIVESFKRGTDGANQFRIETLLLWAGDRPAILHRLRPTATVRYFGHCNACRQRES
jgi:hypothetical protein